MILHTLSHLSRNRGIVAATLRIRGRARRQPYVCHQRVASALGHGENAVESLQVQLRRRRLPLSLMMRMLMLLLGERDDGIAAEETDDGPEWLHCRMCMWERRGDRGGRE